MTGPALAPVQATLAKIAALTPANKAIWDHDELLRLAIERLWILAGTAAESYRRDQGIDPSVGPWSELWAFRCILAHALPGTVNGDRVWYETTADLPRLLHEIR